MFTRDNGCCHFQLSVLAGWSNQRLRELLDERQALASACSAGGSPPQIDAATIMMYRRQTEKLFKCGDPGDRKRLLRMWVQEIRLKPEDLEVSITYRLPESVMNGVVAGGCNAPNALFVPFQLELSRPLPGSDRAQP